MHLDTGSANFVKLISVVIAVVVVDILLAVLVLVVLVFVVVVVVVVFSWLLSRLMLIVWPQQDDKPAHH